MCGKRSEVLADVAVGNTCRAPTIVQVWALQTTSLENLLFHSWDDAILSAQVGLVTA